jgi:acetylornithine deacetylase/succinyl-diaminopimelate desuccinylase-like protein
MADNELDVRPAGEQPVLDEVRINDGWQLRRCRVRRASKPRSRASMRSATRHYARVDVPGIIDGAGCDGFHGVDEYVDLDSLAAVTTTLAATVDRVVRRALKRATKNCAFA